MSETQLQWIEDAAGLESAKSRSVKARIDSLIDWYERFKPDVDEIKTVSAWATLRRFAKPKERGGAELYYRGKRIIAKGQVRSAESDGEVSGVRS